MKSGKCALCDRQFCSRGVVHSKEHLIPNSIGGQKKVSGVLCKTCNDRTGAEWDAFLANQLSLVTTMVKVKRERGANPAIDLVTLSGQPIRVHDDGHLTQPGSAPVEIAAEGGIKISGRVSTLAEARKLFRGLKRKYPKFDEEGALKRLKVETTYLSEPIGGAVYIHGDLAGRSIVKSAYVLAVHSGILPERCEVARRYLKEPAGPACWWFYYDGDPIPDRPTDSLFHCVAVRGNPATRQLLGYLELFGAYRMLILLSSEYDGTDLFSSYAVDPTTGKELAIAPKLDFPAAEVVAVCSGERYRHDVMVAAIDKMMAIAYPKRAKQERDAVLMDAIRTAVPQLGLQPGEAIGPEHVPELVRLMMLKIAPYIISQHEARRRPFPDSFPDPALSNKPLSSSSE
jgi:hypothetical protein